MTRFDFLFLALWLGGGALWISTPTLDLLEWGGGFLQGAACAVWVVSRSLGRTP